MHFLNTSRWHVRLGVLIVLLTFSDETRSDEKSFKSEFPRELVEFTPIDENPIFVAGPEDQWDAQIRERGWILRENGTYRMWYTGYDGTREGLKKLGYATSPDGITWTRSPDNPLFDSGWVEDMMVVMHQGRYFMFAEGRNDQPHLLRSDDGVDWTPVGPLEVRLKDGQPVEPGPLGTPTAWFDEGTWYLFYERRDQGIWLATSPDMIVWTNLQDEPVLKPGPHDYDRDLIALNQIVKHNGRYYAYYHGASTQRSPAVWSTNVAVSSDLLSWHKYEENPLQPIEENKSSGILVHDGEQFRLYTMHDEVHLHLHKPR